MAKLDQDDRLLAELDRRVLEVGVSLSASGQDRSGLTSLTSSTDTSATSGLSSSLPSLTGDRKVQLSRGPSLTRQQNVTYFATTTPAAATQRHQLPLTTTSGHHILSDLPNNHLNGNFSELTHQVSQKIEEIKMAEEMAEEMAEKMQIMDGTRNDHGHNYTSRANKRGQYTIVY